MFLFQERGGNISLQWFYPDKEWEQALAEMLLNGGLEVKDKLLYAKEIDRYRLAIQGNCFRS